MAETVGFTGEFSNLGTPAERRSSAMRVAVVVPCFRVRRHILNVIDGLLPFVDFIFVVDDCCPEFSGALVADERALPTVRVLYNPTNLGVGGAVMRGYIAALNAGFDIIVKFDGDGQMDASQIPYLTAPIRNHTADYAKGNRFFNLEDIAAMPPMRVIGNAGLSFLTKLASGYWDIFDPTNGFTAAHARVLERLPFHKLSNRYFFESDLLFRMGTLRARVIDIPMTAIYGDERSNLSIARIAWPFLQKNVVNFTKRVFYNYLLRNFSIATIYLLAWPALTAIGIALGSVFWVAGLESGHSATAGQVMMAALPLILGAQMLLAFFSYDIEATPKVALHPLLMPLRAKRSLEAS